MMWITPVVQHDTIHTYVLHCIKHKTYFCFRIEACFTIGVTLVMALVFMVSGSKMYARMAKVGVIKSDRSVHVAKKVSTSTLRHSQMPVPLTPYLVVLTLVLDLYIDNHIFDGIHFKSTS